MYPFNHERICELVNKNHGVPLPQNMVDHPVYKAITAFLEKKTPEKEPQEGGIVEEGKIYDGLTRVQHWQAQVKLLEEANEIKRNKRKEEQEEKQEVKKRKLEQQRKERRWRKPRQKNAKGARECR